MLAVTLADRFVDGNDSLGVDLGRRWLARPAIRLITLRPNGCISELAQPRSKCSLDHLGVCRCELVFEGQGLMRPRGESLRINEPLQLGDQLVSQVCGRVRRQTR